MESELAGPGFILDHRGSRGRSVALPEFLAMAAAVIGREQENESLSA